MQSLSRKTILLVCFPLQISAQILITEVMFNPEGSDSPNEFVELYNSGSNAVDLSGWSVSDEAYADELTGPDMLLLPGHFAVIFENDYIDDEDGLYFSILPENILFLQVDDSSIGNGLKNSGDSVFIISENGDTVSTAFWTESTQDGFSLERVVLDYPDLAENWRESLEISGTPGMENSVASFAVDVGIINAWTYPEFPGEYEPIELFLQIGNHGLYPAVTAVYLNDSFITDLAIAINDTLLYNFTIPGLPSGAYNQIFTVFTENDYLPENDLMEFTINVKYSRTDMIINEIMYDPLTGESEWIELYNTTDNAVDLYGWIIDDSDPAESRIFNHHWIQPETFTVVSGDSITSWITMDNFPGLNNSGDQIFLLDPTGRLIDNVNYSSEWGGGEGFSLERLTNYLDSNNPQNWAACTSLTGSTPMQQNSQYVPDMDAAVSLYLAPNPFSPDGDNWEDELIISYHLPFTQAILRADIYDIRGRKMITLSSGESVPMEGILRWDGLREDGKRCVVGQYILKFDAVSENSGLTFSALERVILARQLD